MLQLIDIHEFYKFSKTVVLWHSLNSNTGLWRSFSCAVARMRVVKVPVPKWKFHIFPGIVSAHVISIRFVIGDLLAREIILRNSAGEIPRLRDSTVPCTNTHTRAPTTNEKRVKRYHIAHNTRDGRKCSNRNSETVAITRISFSLSVLPTVHWTKLNSRPSIRNYRGEWTAALKILFYRELWHSNRGNIKKIGHGKKVCIIRKGITKILYAIGSSDISRNLNNRTFKYLRCRVRAISNYKIKGENIFFCIMIKQIKFSPYAFRCKSK